MRRFFGISIDFPALDKAVTLGNRWLDFIESRDTTQAEIDSLTQRIKALSANLNNVLQGAK